MPGIKMIYNNNSNNIKKKSSVVDLTYSFGYSETIIMQWAQSVQTKWSNKRITRCTVSNQS